MFEQKIKKINEFGTDMLTQIKSADLILITKCSYTQCFCSSIINTFKSAYTGLRKRKLHAEFNFTFLSAFVRGKCKQNLTNISTVLRHWQCKKTVTLNANLK